MESIDQTFVQIRQLTSKVVERNLTDGILLSGGLDTSILAFEGSKHTSLDAFTVAFKPASASDVRYAQLVTNYLKMDHQIHFFDEDEAFESVRDVVKILKVFDPMGVRNSVAIYVALQIAEKKGVKSVMTGDGLDELFAGYSWLFDLNETDLNANLSNMGHTMTFTSTDLARSLGLEVKAPYLDPEFKEFAMGIDSKLKIKSETGKKWGKWIIRKSYEGFLPDEILWRVKDPIEIGSGTTVFPKLFETKIPDEYFKDKKKKYLETDQVSIRDKEQLFYYEVYRSFIGVPLRIYSDAMGKICPYCKSKGDERSTFCRICGGYPI